MHLQVKAKIPDSGMSVHDDDDEGGLAISATYQAGALVELLGILESDGFNLRSASGTDVELGGEFNFWVDGRSDDEDEHAATRAAAELLKAKGYEADVWEVHARHLTDTPGALREFVNTVTAGHLLVKDISVSTPDAKGIPVQIFTAKVHTRTR